MSILLTIGVFLLCSKLVLLIFCQPLWITFALWLLLFLVIYCSLPPEIFLFIDTEIKKGLKHDHISCPCDHLSSMLIFMLGSLGLSHFTPDSSHMSRVWRKKSKCSSSYGVKPTSLAILQLSVTDSQKSILFATLFVYPSGPLAGM